ncbi:transposase [Sulfurirhabdus autotrophica]|nr:transposase [Sulfurirhabdus autotrophica]
MEIFLQEVSERHSQKNILMVLDGAGWHKNQSVPLPSNLQLLFLPPYSPELNSVEHLWDDLREKSFHNCVFDSIGALESHLEHVLATFEKDLQRAKSITYWPWIVNALSNAN